eukprot:6202132-Amphidinium_carterae.2
MLPQLIASEAQSNESYNPVIAEVEGYYQPMDNMEALSPDTPETPNTYMPIQWDEGCVVPPYDIFCKDAVRVPPSLDFKMPTGHEHIPPFPPLESKSLASPILVSLGSLGISFLSLEPISDGQSESGSVEVSCIHAAQVSV